MDKKMPPAPKGRVEHLVGPVLIWSGQYCAYWRENARGYTDDPEKAGRYERADAKRRVASCGREKRIQLHEECECGGKPGCVNCNGTGWQVAVRPNA